MKDNIILFEEKKFEIHKHIWLSITWILKRLNSKQTLSDDIREIKLSNWSLLSKTYQKSLLVTRTLIFLNKFMFYLNNRLVPLRILSYREPTLAAPISSWAIYKFFFFLLACNTDSILKSTYSIDCQTSNTKQSVESFYSWTKSHHIFATLK